MGRFGIGARVRDRDGDEVTITGKRKGEREVVYDPGGPLGFRMWWPKAMLTAIDHVPVEPCAEKVEVAFEVGDRVVFTTKNTGFDAIYHDGVLTISAVSGGKVNIDYPPFGDWPKGNLTQVTTPGCLRHFTIEAGKLYRTRDGEKVGPMEDLGRCWFGLSESGSPGHYATNGISAFRGVLPAAPGRAKWDIVAEWVEPIAAVEPPTFSLKLGDKVNLRSGAVATIIETTGANVLPFAHDCGQSRYHAVTASWKSCLGDDDMDIVSVVPEQPFKVGDRVLQPHWGERNIATVIEVGDKSIRLRDRYGVTAPYTNLADFEIAPPAAFPIGELVTAPGLVTGINGANRSVVFDGGISYDLPATALRAA